MIVTTLKENSRTFLTSYIGEAVNLYGVIQSPKFAKLFAHNIGNLVSYARLVRINLFEIVTSHQRS